MPRTQLQKFVNELNRQDQKPIIKVNTISMILKGYMEAGGLHSADVASEIGLSPSGFRSMLGRPETAWSIGDIEKVCCVINCPSAEIYDALARRKNTQAG